MSFRTDPKFARALARFDEANAADPRREEADGQSHPKELLYCRRLYEAVERLVPDASEALLLAARAQHLRRWEIPRSSQPMNRAGYHKWRTGLYAFHAGEAGKILKEEGYDEKTIQRVQSLLRKEGLASDPEMQALEDAICLVFLEYEFAAFAPRHDDEKIIGILQKTWKKMSERGHEAALKLDLPEEAKRLVAKALGGA